MTKQLILKLYFTKKIFQKQVVSVLMVILHNLYLSFLSNYFYFNLFQVK